MDYLAKLIEENEDWLMKRILQYAGERGYTQYTSTLEEAWRLSISSLSASLLEGIKKFNDIPDFGPEETFEKGPLTSFGVIEARRRRERGINLPIFLGLMKYYKQCYIDLLIQKSPRKKNLERDRLFIERSFDRMEIAYCQTQWRSAEKRLSRMGSIVENSTDAIFGKTLEGVILSWNTGAERMYGYTAEEAVGQSVSILVPPDKPDEVTDFLERIKNGETIDHYETQRIHKDGREIHVSLTVSPIRDAEGNIIEASVIARDITVDKLAEVALVHSEARFRGAFENAANGIALTSLEGKFLMVNPAFCHITGYEEEELLQTDFMSITHPDDQETGRKQRKQVLAGAIPSFRMEKRYIHKNGHSVWISVSVSLVKDSQGDPLHLVGQIVDLTELKKVEAALRRQSLMVDTVHDGIIVTDMDGCVTGWNKGAENLFGYTREEVLGKTTGILHKPEEAPMLTQLILDGIVRDGHWTGEIDYIRKDGKTGICETVVVPLLDEEKQVTATIGINRDITRRKKMEQQLMESERRLRRAVLEAPFPMIIHAEDGEVIMISRTWTEITGYTHKDIPTIKDWTSKAYPGKEEQRTNLIMDMYGIKKRFHVGEMDVTTADGDIRTWDFSSAPLGNLPDGRRAIISIAGDITEHKESERQLLRAREAAEAANLAKSQFLSTMSHEIRTPLNAVIGMGEVLSETVMSPEQHQFLRTLNTAGDDLLAIINDILDLSKIETGHFELESIPFNLREVVEKTCDILAVRAHKKNLELVARVHPDASLHVEGDPYRLRQILINLVGNAVKFTDTGHVLVEVKRLNDIRAETPVTIQFSVEDTGIGIPPEKQETIFDSFSQVDSSTTRKYGGTGLGLAISKHLTQMMGGAIRVESIPGEGSRFTFSAQFRFLHEDEKIILCGDIDLEGMKTLVVDDHSANRLIIREILTGWGAVIHEAENGETALAELAAAREVGEPYRLVLLDRNMPKMDGFETARRMREDPGSTAACALMLTSDFGPGDIERSKKLGLHRYLIKPLKREDLKQVICEILQGASPVDAAAGRPTPAPAADTANLPQTRILLVEDSIANQNVVEAFLAANPVKIDIAGNGMIALEKFKINAYHLVLMDIQMPVMDGLTATREIRKWETEHSRPRTPIVAMSAHALVGDSQKSLDAGCDTHLPKPIKKNSFMKTLDKYLQLSIQAPALPGNNEPHGETVPEDPGQRIPVRVDPVLQPYVDEFLQSLEQNISEIRDCLEKGDFKNIKLIGHKMKGDGGTFGFHGIGRLGADIQAAAEQRDRENIEHLLSQLADYLVRVEVL